jgi:hypothetical protein
MWKAILGRDLGDGTVGFCGAAASVMYIFEMLLKETRKLK